MNYMTLPQRVTGRQAARALYRLKPRSGDLNILSFKEVRFIDPFGIIMAAEFLRYLFFASERVAIYLPLDTAALGYLRRSRFVEFAANLGQVLPESKAFYSSTREEEWLLPLTPLRHEGEIPDLVGRIFTALKSLFEKSRILEPVLANQLSTLLAELCQNVTQHSQDLGLVIAQVYRYHNDRDAGEKGRFLQLAVGDLGIGLRGSLSKRYQTLDWDDAEVIRQALRQGVSSLSDEGRGLGLAQVYQKTALLKGSMLLHSGSSLLHSTGGGDEFSESAYFPGTQIALEYHTSRMK
ncbi:MAG: hypothetical protein FWE76_00870 [Symbiobacteriaceae bacterium]|nr:hypothetical protein [Symbiobacteriaceae bacterium]